MKNELLQEKSGAVNLNFVFQKPAELHNVIIDTNIVISDSGYKYLPIAPINVF